MSEIADAVRECDATKFINASFKHLPFETVIVPPIGAAAIYARFYCPWRHQRWPYNAEQTAARARLGINLSPPYYNVQKLLPFVAAAFVLDVSRKLILDR